MPRHDPASVAVGERRWRRLFVIAFVGLTAIKAGIAATLAPFADEAFYWQESRHLAWGYSDLPPLTAWLIRLGEEIAGHGVLGMRWPFLLIGSALPWLVAAFARDSFIAQQRATIADAEFVRVGGAAVGWQAGLLCLVLPLAGSLGVLALPDVPLTVAIMLGLLALLRAMDANRWRDWLLLGFALAVCWLTHYRAAMPMLAGLLLLVVMPRGRMQWRRGGLWLALAVAALGLIPLLLSNWQQRGAGLAFQLLERNPWQFHADALVQPLEQALACTPLLYALLLWAAWRSWRRRGEGAPWDLIAVFALTFIVLYFVLGLFADDLRFRAHWPLPGYLPLLAALPLLWRGVGQRRAMRILLVCSVTLAALGQLAGMAYLGLAAVPGGARVLSGVKAFPRDFVGWNESGELAARLLHEHPGVLVADNFMLAAELDFQLDGRVPIYALDSPLNTKHGRAPQLAIWRMDETALHAAHAGEPVLLAVDETVLPERDRAGWLGSLCQRLRNPQALQRLDLYQGRKRVAFYRVEVSAAKPAADTGVPSTCPILSQAQAAGAR